MRNQSISKINMPVGAKKIIENLTKHGFEAYVVGGCVRDSLLGYSPKDWDICTSATPEVIKELHSHTIDTGLKHGTVSVVESDGIYEVTTFRVDGVYSDNRRPDAVEFVTDLKMDLSRRDFTVNAMAYNDEAGVIDYYGGLSDLAERKIKCVGNAGDRFDEDALRILRAIRFSSVYGFLIEHSTSRAIHDKAALLQNIASERIRSELCKTIVFGQRAADVLLEYSDVVSIIIPEIEPCIGFVQNNRFHKYDVYEHMVRAMEAYAGRDLSVKFALLIHDIGKPLCYTEDENGGHFYGHSVPSHDIAERVVDRLKFDNKTKEAILELVLYHDSVIEPTAKTVKRWLNRIGAERLSQLLDVKMADIAAHADNTQTERINQYLSVRGIAKEIIVSEQCFQLKDLEINGRDIMSLGIEEGKRVGEILNCLLEGVIAGDIDNTYGALLKCAREIIEKEVTK